MILMTGPPAETCATQIYGYSDLGHLPYDGKQNGYPDEKGVGNPKRS
jgi:hypothetical protein